MELSSTFCRMQENVQRDRATNAKLQNVRLVAGKAAKAWDAVALAAEQREARRERTRIIADIKAFQNQPAAIEDRLLSENPDRGFENFKQAREDPRRSSSAYVRIMRSALCGMQKCRS